MKAAFIDKCGTAENIRFGDLPDPVPEADGVPVQVEAVAVNPVDTYIRSGAFPMALPFAFIIGRDLVGTIALRSSMRPGPSRPGPDQEHWGCWVPERQ